MKSWTWSLHCGVLIVLFHKALQASSTPWMIMVYEETSNHGSGRNVLFLDSHVEWVPEERFQELIKRDNE